MDKDQLSKLEIFIKERGTNIQGVIQGGKSITITGITENIQ